MRMAGLALAASIVAAPAAGQIVDPEREAAARMRACPPQASQTWCKMIEAGFPSQYPKALQGDYQSQRNVAFLLSGAWEPAIDNPVLTNTSEACAWRIVIVKSAQQQPNPVDVRNRDVDCGRKGANRRTAEAHADELLRRIRSAKSPPTGR